MATIESPNKPQNDPGSQDSMIRGQCRCGCVTYEFPKAAGLDINDKGMGELYRILIIPPEKQKFPERGGNLNKWRANHCHCAACTQTAGALVVSWAYIPLAHLKVNRKEKTGIYRASNHASREFCQICGSCLFFQEDGDKDGLDVTLATVTTPNLFNYFEPANHIWLEDVADIVLDEHGKGGGFATVCNDGLPRFKQNTTSEPF
ncbi:hypothetical protein FRC17_005814 [Serendipita sp. 399]|nr:hypothetical protein FRC17_005814 [Serendipita sp. 399]